MQEKIIKGADVNIKVVGIGGGGNSVLQRIASEGSLGMELIAINTDKKQLHTLDNQQMKILPIGENVTRGLGSGGKVVLGQQAAQKDEILIKNAITGADMIFLTAGLGGGTGTGAMPVIAEMAHSMGILTIGIVTMPFPFEGSRKKRTALASIEQMRPFLDALIDIQNDKLMEFQAKDKRISLLDAFHLADGVLKQAISCISELILTVGVINVDFADVKSIFQQNNNADALLGIGEGATAVKAVQAAIVSPLIERQISGARGIILNISGDESLSLYEVNEATKFIYDNTSPEVNIILGTVINSQLKGKVRATVIATDFTTDDDMDKNQKGSYTDRAAQTKSPELPDFMRGKSTGPHHAGHLNKAIFDIERINKELADRHDKK
ncbi:cell division protein FtsZ [Pectinatus frisingensis]|uniref:cell division protein FtsZ n=2 Tax=Pectinatus frisingensis TaxID=865 RepID=UPI0015F660F4|nr:cell division protein FtsZ [Pectinatus frisingensis]